jgi:hypothetical protein
MATVLTAGRRCSRRRLDVVGGAASVFTVAPRSGPAPPRSRTASPSSGSSRSRRFPAATRWRDAAHGLPPLLLLFSHSPLPFTYRRRGHWKGAKPHCGLVGEGRVRSRGDVDAQSRRREGMDAPGAPGLAACAGSATWPALSGRHRAWGVTGRGTGVLSPVDSSPGVGHGCARRLGVRAGWAVRPPPPRAHWCGEIGGAKPAR